jgi:hypothetical protein
VASCKNQINALATAAGLKRILLAGTAPELGMIHLSFFFSFFWLYFILRFDISPLCVLLLVTSFSLYFFILFCNFFVRYDFFYYISIQVTFQFSSFLFSE